jgi:hypothetical protein
VLNNKNPALQNFSVSEMYENIMFLVDAGFLCKASMAAVLSDMTKDTSCIIYSLTSKQPPILWVSVALPWKGEGRGGYFHCPKPLYDMYIDGCDVCCSTFPLGCAHMVPTYRTICVPEVTIWTPQQPSQTLDTSTNVSLLIVITVTL